ncbi:DUF3253 domain-containing protein [Nocardioides sp. Y6]|uniref:DUF3253 domain-containing protein n=1 Tax=Nocardioides malaquae TaxID=2773426 RepID=A0ABR9RUH7_9ACTN|nr:DUF3253 domain-containing protein [Nocardioides malaquae]MBE7325206.1 DUF3253 domain-containing protein [Nocardioides malaquae]
MPDSAEVERTEDGRHVVVDGRRWRASDPAIPEALRQELVDELMSARRAVRTTDEQAKVAARGRVQDAKVALGERGHPWWEAPTDEARTVRITATIRALLRKRDGKSICPSDVARVVGGEAWREEMPRVRAVAGDLAARGELTVTQKGHTVTVDAGGPIRLARGPGFDA